GPACGSVGPITRVSAAIRQYPTDKEKSASIRQIDMYGASSPFFFRNTGVKADVSFLNGVKQILCYSLRVS
ncbi:hypothetical protein L2E23_25085, partial [Salmonella enterica subsp. enterica serovar Weltevreden]|uniref:hypothetical protein n=1 Tax=Salmonella enterica TaxID=28901 RepID=UPI001F25719F